MPAEKSLLQRIHADYVASQPKLPPEAAAAITAFQDYADKWLSESGIVGLGYSATGLALRFKSAEVIPLFSTPASPLANTPSVNITGNESGINPTTGSRPLDVAITGT